MSGLRAPGFLRSIHVVLASAVVLMVAVGLAGCALTGVHIVGMGLSAPFDLAMGGMFFLPVAYAHRNGYTRVRDGVVFLFWANIINQASGPIVFFVARLKRPLEDARLAAIDRAFGVNIGAIHAWSETHELIAAVLSIAYTWLPSYLLVAILLPIIFKHRQRTEVFFIANVIGFLGMLPLFALAPAIGPWAAYHFTPSIWQMLCQKQVLAIRASGPVWTSAFDGVVAFPSMHVFWAVLCAWALYPVRWLRVPAIAFSALIIFSTMTMGWHYFCDVLAGFLLASACIAISWRVSNHHDALTSGDYFPEGVRSRSAVP